MKPPWHERFLGIHFHKWTETPAIPFGGSIGKRATLLGMYKENARRICCCGAVQEQEVHCLGLNPPTYVKRWRTVK